MQLFQDDDEEFDVLQYRKFLDKNPIFRQPCNISEEEFVNKFVKRSIPVILTNCEGYDWLEKYDITVDTVTKVSCIHNKLIEFTL